MVLNKIYSLEVHDLKLIFNNNIVALRGPRPGLVKWQHARFHSIKEVGGSNINPGKRLIKLVKITIIYIKFNTLSYLYLDLYAEAPGEI